MRQFSPAWRLNLVSPLGEKPLFEVSLKATDLDGQPIQTDPTFLEVEFVNEADPVVGYSDAMILRSGTILDYAESLILIGELYYDCREEIDETNYLRDEIWRNQSENPDISESSYENLTSPRIQELERSIAAKMDRAMDLAVSMKKVMENVRLRLDNEGFEDELDVMEKYIRILGEELELDEERVTVIVQDREINPNVSDRNFSDHMDNLFKEMTLDLKTRSAGTVAVSGFTMSDGNTPSLVTMLNESAVVEFGRIDTLTLVERGRLEVVLEEQSLQLTGLVDTNTAIRVGELLAAEFIVTGSVIEMASSVVIFGRVINVETAEVESVAQVIVPKDRNVLRLLNS
jgi:TolB-like protein